LYDWGLKDASVRSEYINTLKAYGAKIQALVFSDSTEKSSDKNWCMVSAPKKEDGLDEVVYIDDLGEFVDKAAHAHVT